MDPTKFQKEERIFSQKKDWIGLARLYEQAVRQSEDKDFIAKNLLKAGQLFRDRLNDARNSAICFERAAKILQSQVSTESDSKRKSDLLCDLAETYVKVIKDREKAIEAYVEAFELDPKKVFLMDVIGNLYTDKENWGDIVEHFEDEAAVAKDPVSKAELLQEGADIYAFILSEPEKAKVLYRDILKLDPNNTKAMAALESLLVRDRNWDELSAFYLALKDRLKEVSAQVTLSSKLALLYKDKLGQPLQAVREYEEILVNDPQNFRISSKLEELKGDRNAWSAAILTLDQILEKKDLDMDRRVSVLIEKSTILERYLNQESEATRCIHELLALAPANRKVLQRAAEYWNTQRNFGELAHTLEKTSEATDDLQTQIQALHELSRVSLTHLSDTGRATKALEKIIKLRPADFRAREALIAIYEKQERWEQLEGLLRDSASISAPETRFSLLRKLAKVQESHLGLETAALDTHEEILKQNPSDHDSLKALERLYAATRNWRKLTEILQTQANASTDTAERAEYLLQAGRVLEEKLNQLLEAAHLYETVLFLNYDENDLASRIEQIYFAERSWKHLIDFYKKIESTSADPSDSIRWKMKIADIYLSHQKDSISASQVLKSLLEKDPKNLEALRTLQNIAKESGNRGEYVSLLREEINLLTTSHERTLVLHRISDILLEGNESKDSIDRVYEEILREDPSDPIALERLIHSYRAAKQYTQLVPLLKTQLEKTTETRSLARLHNELAQVMTSLQNESEAILHFEKALHYDGSLQEARLSLAKIFAKREKWDDLIGTYIHELDHTQDRFRASEIAAKVGQLYDEKLGRPLEAIPFFERAVELNSSDLPSLLRLSNLLSPENQTEKLIRVLERIIDHSSARQDQMKAALSLGSLYETKKRDLTLAAQWYEKALTLKTDDPTATEKLTRIYETLELWDPLLHLFERSLVTKEGDDAADLHHAMGSIYENRLHQNERALIAYQLATELNPNHIEALSSLRRLLALEENWGEYLKTTEQQAKITDNAQQKAALYAEIGFLWRDRFHQADRAMESFETSFRYDKTQIKPIEALAFLKHELHDTKEALAYAQQALDVIRDPGKRIPLLLLVSSVQEVLGQAKDASDALREILSLDPANRGALSKLCEIQEKERDWRGLLSTKQLLLDLETDKAEKIRILQEMAELWATKLGSKENAVEALQAVLRLDPTLPIPLEKLGELTSDQEKWFRFSEAHVKRLLEQDAHDRYVEVLCAVVRVHSNRFRQEKRAIQLLEAAIQDGISDARLFAQLADIYDRNADHKKAALATQRYAEKVSDPKEKRIAFYKAAERWTNLPEGISSAIECFDAIVELDPKDDEARRNLVQLFYRTQNWERACQTLDQLIKGREASESLRFDYLFQKAEILSEHKNQNKDALDILQELISLRSDHEPTLVLYAQLLEKEEKWTDLAESLEKLIDLQHGHHALTTREKLAIILEEKLEKLDEAAEQWEVVSRLQPKDQKTLSHLVQIHQKREDYPSLVIALQRQVATEKDSILVSNRYFQLGDILQNKLHHQDKAFSYYQASFEKNPKNNQVFGLLKDFYQGEKRFSDLAELYARRAEASTTDEAIAHWLESAEIWRTELHNPVKSLEAIHHALHLSPKHTDALARKASILFDQENFRAYAETLEILESSVDNPSIRTGILMDLAAVYKGALRDNKRAILAYESILKIDPSHEESLRSLRTLFEETEQWSHLVSILKALIDTDENNRSPALLKELATLEIQKLRKPHLGIATLENCHKYYPRDTDVIRKLIDLYQEHQFSQKLIDLLESSLSCFAQEHDHLTIQILMADTYAEGLKNPHKSISILESLDRTKVEPIRILEKLENLYRKTNQHAKADEILLEKAKSLDPGSERNTILETLGMKFWKERMDYSHAIDAFQLLSKDSDYAHETLEKIAAIHRETKNIESLLHTLSLLEEGETRPERKARYLTEMGRLYDQKLNQHSKARNMFSDALKVSPHFLEAVDALYDFYLNRNELESAVQLLAQEIEEHRDPRIQTKLLRNLGNLLQTKLNRKEEAIAIYERLIHIAPHEMDAVAVLADLYFEQGKWERASPLLERLVKVTSAKKDPGKTAHLHYQLGRVSAKLHRSDQAILHFNQALNYDANHFESIRGLADLYFQLGQWKNALKMLQRVISVGRDEDDEYVAAQYYRLIQTLEKLDKPLQAVELFEKAPKPAQQHLGTLKTMMKLYRKLERWKDTRDIAERILNLALSASDRHDALFELADIHFYALKNPKIARKHIEALLEIEPTHHEGWELFYDLCKKESDWPQAIQALEELIRLTHDPKKLSMYAFELGTIMDREMGDLHQARSYYFKAIEHHSVDQKAMEALERLCKSDEDWIRLSEAYEKLIEESHRRQNPVETSRYQIALSRILQNRLGKSNEALLMSKEAARNDPGSKLAQKELFEKLNPEGDLDLCKECVNRLLEHHHRDKDVLDLAHEFYQGHFPGHFRSALVEFVRNWYFHDLSLTASSKTILDRLLKKKYRLSEMRDVLSPEMLSPLALVLEILGESVFRTLANKSSNAILTSVESVPDHTRSFLLEMGKALDLDTKKWKTIYSSNVETLEIFGDDPVHFAVGPGLYRYSQPAQEAQISEKLHEVRLGLRLIHALSFDALIEVFQPVLDHLAHDRHLPTSLETTIPKKQIKLAKSVLGNHKINLQDAEKMLHSFKELSQANILLLAALSIHSIDELLQYGFDAKPQITDRFLQFLLTEELSSRLEKIFPS